MAKPASRRSSAKRSSSQATSRQVPWQKWLLALTLVPLAGGGILIFGALANIVVWGSRGDQITMGVFYILFSFVASNAIQKQWSVSAGWLFLGVALWLVLNSSNVSFRVVAAALAGVGGAMVAREFLQRARQNAAKSKKGKR